MSDAVSQLEKISDALPDYNVEREIGRGGMGVVYLGRHKRLDRGVAIKELPPAFAVEEEVRERFSSEARTLASLAHPHIVPIYDYVEREGLCLIVMEQLPGGTVWDQFTTTGLTPPRACAIVMACCAALEHAHNKGVLHLDVKPDNLMYDDASAVKVTDFGISRVLSGGKTLGTVDGQVLGTPAYMSPEQAKGATLSPASDVYAAAVMLYELLSGNLPWSGAQNASELLTQRLNEEPTPIQELAPHVPDALAHVVMKGLRKDPTQRYQRAEDFGVAIGEAAAKSWGPEWIDVSGIAIVGSERLSLAARTTGQRPARAAAAAAAAGAADAETLLPGTRATKDETIVTGPAPEQTRAGETVIGSAAASDTGANETMVTGPSVAAGDATPAPKTMAGGRPASETTATGPITDATTGDADEPTVGAGDASPPTAPPQGAVVAGGMPDFQVVRAAGAEPRIQGANLNRLERADLIGVEDMLDPPRPPWPSILVAVLFFVVAIAVALVGIGEPSFDETLEPGQVEVAGVDVASGDQIEIDFSSDVVVLVTDAELAAQTDDVTLEASLLGIPLGSASANLEGDTATIDPGLMQRLVAGGATGTVILEGPDAQIVSSEFPIDATQSWFLTILGVGAILVVLLAIANLESSLKPLRRGRLRTLSVIGAAVSCAIAGIGVVFLVDAALGTEATIPTLVVVALLGAAGGCALSVAAVGVARRRRVRGAVKRAERQLGVRVTGRGTGAAPAA